MLEGSGGRDVYVIIAVTSVDVNIPSVPRRRLNSALKYKREHITALQLERFMTSVPGRIDQERTAAMKKPEGRGGPEARIQ
jgi:hypothetical protein